EIPLDAPHFRPPGPVARGPTAEERFRRQVVRRGRIAAQGRGEAADVLRVQPPQPFEARELGHHGGKIPGKGKTLHGTFPDLRRRSDARGGAPGRYRIARSGGHFAARASRRASSASASSSPARSAFSLALTSARSASSAAL